MRSGSWRVTLAGAGGGFVVGEGFARLSWQYALIGAALVALALWGAARQ